MTYRISVYFLGAYRPANFESEHLHDAFEVFRDAVADCDRDARNKLYGWFIAGELAVTDKRSSTTAWSCEHGALGVSIRKDPAPASANLERVCADLPAFPGLDYSRATLVRKEVQA